MHWPINHDPEPVRLFKSDFMEFFTHIHPAVVVAIWLPVTLFFLIRAIVIDPAGASAFYIPAGFFAGLFLWTLTEYLMHRFVFHYRPKTERMEKFFFTFHGVHHVQPQCKTRLVMPPVVSIPLALVFYGLFILIFSVILPASQWISPLMSGFILGYLIYDIAHYATHHFPMRAGYLKYLKRYHMQHHYKTPEQRFGVSSPIWDFVFSTHPSD